MQHKVDIMICTKDRPSEVGLLLQSLRSQTFQNFDIYIFDDRSGQPIQNFNFIQAIINRLKLENHCVTIWRNDIPFGVTRLRQMMVERILEVGNGDCILRLDDDNLLEPDFIEKLVETIDAGYDIAGCLVPHCTFPFIKRETKYAKPFIGNIEMNDNGEITLFNDDCGIEYITKEIIPSPTFRSMALMKKEVHQKVKYEDNLGFCSYREEQFFSFRAILAGFKIAVNTGAIAYHLATPSGGERTEPYQKGIVTNHELLNKWCKKQFEEHGDFLKKYKEQFK
jgi:GT2 family glycosyltransferase